MDVAPFGTATSSMDASMYALYVVVALAVACAGLNGLNVLVSPELGNSETRKRSESCLEDLGTLAEAACR